MRIDALNKISELYQSSNVKNTSKAKNASFQDTLEISSIGKGVQVAKQAVAKTPDVRESKINDIKQRMEAGTYNVTLEDVVNKLIDENLE